MADVATPSAATMATTDTTASTASTASASKTKQQFVKPEKPDEEQYKTELARAEKEHAASQERLVRALTCLPITCLSTP
jgi:hypothetical protein